MRGMFHDDTGSIAASTLLGVLHPSILFYLHSLVLLRLIAGGLEWVYRLWTEQKRGGDVCGGDMHCGWHLYRFAFSSGVTH
jgi:hypothetical protein